MMCSVMYVHGSTDLVGRKVKERVRKELERLRESGIIVPSTSPWSFPLVPVRKPDGTIRIRVDNKI